MQNLLQLAGSLTGIYTESLNIDESFENLAARFAHEPGTVVLMSGGDLDCARYHLLGVWPWLSFKGKDRAMRVSGFWPGAGI